MMNYLTIAPLLILAPLLSLMTVKANFLMCLLNLEMMMLGIITMTLISQFSSPFTESMNSLIILSLSACEASLGLACLVVMMRTQGNDNIKSLMTIKC